MDKIEFKKYCNEEFKRRGFKKIRKNEWHYKGINNIDCILWIDFVWQSYEINYFYFIDWKEDRFPEITDCDLVGAFILLSKDTIKGEKFMTSRINYLKYELEEIEPYFNLEFEEHVMPVLEIGKERLKEELETYLYKWHKESDIKAAMYKLEN